MARFQILYWQDVPSVIKAYTEDGSEVKRQLGQWFQQEIDRRAMEQGLVGSEASLDEWRWGDVEDRAGSPDEVLDALERELSP